MPTDPSAVRGGRRARVRRMVERAGILTHHRDFPLSEERPLGSSASRPGATLFEPSGEEEHGLIARGRIRCGFRHNGCYALSRWAAEARQ
jgi:hypothetical protein